MTGKWINWIARRALAFIGVAIVGGLVVIFFYRLGYGGDWLVPLIGLFLVFVSAAVFSVLLDLHEDMAEVKRCAVAFVQQAREETEYLSAMSDVEKIIQDQHPDLN